MELREGFKMLRTLPSDRGEVAVTLVCGKATIEQAKGSFLVRVQPEHAKEAFKGYTFPNSQIRKIVEKAMEEDSHVILRFEKQRKKGIDINIPLEELAPPGDLLSAKKNIFNSCVGVYDVNNKRWIIDGGFSDPNLDPAESQSFIDFCINGRKEPVNLDNFFKDNSPLTESQLTAPNISTFDRQQILLTIYFWLKDREKDGNYELKEEARRDLTIRLFKLVDKIYLLFKGETNGHININEYAHARARFALFRYGEVNKPLNEDAIKNLNAWMKECYLFYQDLFDWAGNN